MAVISPQERRTIAPETLPKYRAGMYRHARAMGLFHEDAEDLVQETFMRVLAKPRQIVIHANSHSDTYWYLIQALRNTHVNRLRSLSSRPTGALSLDDPNVEFDVANPRNDTESGAQRRILLDVIAALPDTARRLILAVDVRGLSYRDAGNVAGLRQSSVADSVFNARAKCARGLREAGI